MSSNGSPRRRAGRTSERICAAPIMFCLPIENGNDGSTLPHANLLSPDGKLTASPTEKPFLDVERIPEKRNRNALGSVAGGIFRKRTAQCEFSFRSSHGQR